MGDTGTHWETVAHTGGHRHALEPWAHTGGTGTHWVMRACRGLGHIPGTWAHTGGLWHVPRDIGTRGSHVSALGTWAHAGGHGHALGDTGTYWEQWHTLGTLAHAGDMGTHWGTWACTRVNGHALGDPGTHWGTRACTRGHGHALGPMAAVAPQPAAPVGWRRAGCRPPRLFKRRQAGLD